MVRDLVRCGWRHPAGRGGALPSGRGFQGDGQTPWQASEGDSRSVAPKSMLALIQYQTLFPYVAQEINVFLWAT